MPPGPFHIPRRHTPDQIDAIFAAQRQGDPIGWRIHLALALGACFFAGWSTSFVEWCALPVLICFLVRMTGWHRVLEPLAFDRVLRFLLAWGAFVALSLLWSAGTTWNERLVDIKPLRFLPLAVILWPVMDRRSWLILALMAGIACGQLAQFTHLLTLKLDLGWMPFHRMPGRISGWWDPVSGGTVLCAALGLWLAPALFAPGRARLLGAIGVAATLVCITLTGTRGAWIGAALLCGITLPIKGWHWRLARQCARAGAAGAPPRWAIGAALGAMVVLGGAAIFAGGTKIADRFQRGVEEVNAALTARDYSTDTGLRIAMWQWSIAAAKSHPVVGLGAGGYQPWVHSQSPESAAHLGAPIEAAPHVHSHAHSWYLHTIATLGVVGLALLLALTITAVASGLRPPLPATPPIKSALAFAPALALLGLACAGLFDTITVSQQPVFLFYLLIALSLPSRPREAGVAT
ncbi:MAG TPA: O-antigen ligase family protein [Phycisphaerales bacterium]|nr:O-antigen ligase family protein [Phycisphaerales bacterium]